MAGANSDSTLLDLVRLTTHPVPDRGLAVEALLARLQDHFGLPLAVVSHIEDGRYTVMHARDQSGAIVPGLQFQLGETYCERVLAQEKPLYVTRAAAGLFRALPSYRTVVLETYLGIRILTAGKIYGTLSLGSPSLRSGDFGAKDALVLETAAALIGTQIELQQADYRLTLAASRSSVGLWDWDLRSGAIYWSGGFHSLLGIAPEHVQPGLAGFEARVHPDDGPQVMAALARHLETREPFDVEYRLRHERGHYLWVLARGQAVWNAAGEAIRMAGSVDDISDRKRAAAALARSEERYQLAVAGTGVGVWDWDLITGEMYWSDQMRLMLAVTDHEPHQTISTFAHYIHEDDRQRVLDQLNLHLAGKAEYRLDFRRRRTDGAVIWVHTRGQAVWDADGNPVRMAGSCYDITGRKRAEMRVSVQAEELRRTNLELEQFASIASHDLQEPLRKIASFGEILERDYADRLDERGSRMVRGMVDGAVRLRRLIDDLLQYSRSSNDRMRFEDVVLDDLVAEICDDLDIAIAESGARVECQAPSVLRGDRSLMRQVFQNLLSNALKYRGSTPPLIRIYMAPVPDRNQWHIRVQDNGIGFANAHATRIFRIFKRLHGRAEYEGTGIGLALCQRVVERHGGRIWAEGVRGEGACFHIEWPVLPDESVAQAKLAPGEHQV